MDSCATSPPVESVTRAVAAHRILNVLVMMIVPWLGRFAFLWRRPLGLRTRAEAPRHNLVVTDARDGRRRYREADDVVGTAFEFRMSFCARQAEISATNSSFGLRQSIS